MGEVHHAPLLRTMSDASGDSMGMFRRSSEATSKRRLDELRKCIQKKRDDRAHAYQKLQILETVMSERQLELRHRIRELDLEAAAGESDLRRHLSALEEPSEGPALSRLVDSRCFTLCSACVLLVNCCAFAGEFMQPEKVNTWEQLNVACLVFYTVEILVGAVIHKQGLLLGPASVVWGNWADLFIIICGFGGVAGLGGDRAVMQWLLRLPLSARVFKFVCIFCKADFSWACGPAFEGGIMAVILFNAIVMGIEDEFPHFPLWWWLNQTMLFVFVFELLVKCKGSCREFFCGSDCAWNWLDFIIVAGGIMDQWVAPVVAKIIESDRHAHMAQVVMMLRMARLLRILRLVRLVKKIKPLYTLVVGIAQAMHGMGWVVALTVVWLYMGGLLFVKLIGHGVVFGESPPAQVQELFADVPTAMWVLFKVMNSDVDDLSLLLEEKPYFKLVIAIFMIISSWAILSILTAVVSENMIAATEELLQESKQDKEAENKSILLDLFDSVDNNSDGMMTASEFERLLADDVLVKQLSITADCNSEDLVDLFDLLSTAQVEEDGRKVPCIEKDEFIGCLLKQSGQVNEKSIRRLEKRLTTLVREQTRLVCCEIQKAIAMLPRQQEVAPFNVTPESDTLGLSPTGQRDENSPNFHNEISAIKAMLGGSVQMQFHVRAQMASLDAAFKQLESHIRKTQVGLDAEFTGSSSNREEGPAAHHVEAAGDDNGFFRDISTRPSASCASTSTLSPRTNAPASTGVATAAQRKFADHLQHPTSTVPAKGDSREEPGARVVALQVRRGACGGKMPGEPSQDRGGSRGHRSSRSQTNQAKQK